MTMSDTNDEPVLEAQVSDEAGGMENPFAAETGGGEEPPADARAALSPTRPPWTRHSPSHARTGSSAASSRWSYG